MNDAENLFFKTQMLNKGQINVKLLISIHIHGLCIYIV